MNKLDLIRMGLNNLSRRKTRTFLTILGVMIGTAAIVTMMSLGFGMKYAFQDQVEQMGSVTIIEVSPSYNQDMSMMGNGRSTNGANNLDDKTIAEFSMMEGVEAVSPQIESYVRIVSGKYAADIPIRGINPVFMTALGLQVQEGRLLQKNDGTNIIFGAETLLSFIDPKAKDPWKYMNDPSQTEGQEPKVNVLKDKLYLTFDTTYGARKSPTEEETTTSIKKAILFKVQGIGILQGGQMDSDYAAYMDITQLKKLIQQNAKTQDKSEPGYKQNLAEQLKYQIVKVKVKDIDDVTPVQDKIKAMGFETFSLNEVTESMQKTSNTLQMILGGIGAVSLLVAALGITNTMTMAIYERTREIGIMKVIGASFKDIKRLFLFEAGMIGFLGGLLGNGISFILSLLLNVVGKNSEFFMGMGGGGDSNISVIPTWLALAVMGLSTIIGLVSGYFPARRAMRLSALEAIKND